MNQNLPRLSLIESLEVRQFLSAALPVTIDFGPADKPYAGGTLGDGGAVLADRGNGYVYGWNTGVSAGAVDRDSSYTPYQRYDSNIAMPAGATWDLKLGSGKYKVKVGGGDSAIWGANLNITAEGKTVVSGTTTSSKRLIENTITLDVTDGGLTLGSGAGASGNRVTYVTIEYVGPASTPTPNPNPNPTPGGTATVSGYVVNDLNKDGLWTSGEKGLAGRTVYLDANKNGALDAGELTQVTASNGKYVFANPPAGSITIRQVLPDGWAQTKPSANAAFTFNVTAGGTFSGKDFATALTGSANPNPNPNPTPTTLTWVKKASMPINRVEPQSAVVGGKLYVFGGYDDANFQPDARVDVYDAASDTWTRLKDLPIGLTHAGTAVVGTQVWMAGGYLARAGTVNGQDIAVTQVLIYDTVTDTYSYGPPLPAQRASTGLVLVGSTLYCFGGEDRSRANKRESWALDLNNQSAGWVRKADVPDGRSHFGYVAVNGEIYMMAGQRSVDAYATFLKSSYAYNPATNTWRQIADLPSVRSHLSPNTLAVNGKIYMFGGESSFNVDIREVLEYDPAANTYRTLTSLPADRASGAAGYINGKFVFTGGKDNALFKDTYVAAFA